MITHRALFLAFALALLGAPAVAQGNNGNGCNNAGSQIGPAMMNDIKYSMRTMMNDPTIVNRMNQMMATNPEFKERYGQMRSMMKSQGWMMNGSGGMMQGSSGNHGPMMSAPATSKP